MINHVTLTKFSKLSGIPRSACENNANDWPFTYKWRNRWMVNIEEYNQYLKGHEASWRGLGRIGLDGGGLYVETERDRRRLDELAPK